MDYDPHHWALWHYQDELPEKLGYHFICDQIESFGYRLQECEFPLAVSDLYKYYAVQQGRCFNCFASKLTLKKIKKLRPKQREEFFRLACIGVNVEPCVATITTLRLIVHLINNLA